MCLVHSPCQSLTVIQDTISSFGTSLLAYLLNFHISLIMIRFFVLKIDPSRIKQISIKVLNASCILQGPLNFCLFTMFLIALELKYKGSSAAERNGVFYAISDDDHPVTMLLQDPNKISRGMAAHIGLRLKKVCVNSCQSWQWSRNGNIFRSN